MFPMFPAWSLVRGTWRIAKDDVQLVNGDVRGLSTAWVVASFGFTKSLPRQTSRASSVSGTLILDINRPDVWVRQSLQSLWLCQKSCHEAPTGADSVGWLFLDFVGARCRTSWTGHRIQYSWPNCLMFCQAGKVLHFFWSLSWAGAKILCTENITNLNQPMNPWHLKLLAPTKLEIAHFRWAQRSEVWMYSRITFEFWMPTTLPRWLLTRWHPLKGFGPIAPNLSKRWWKKWMVTPFETSKNRCARNARFHVCWQFFLPKTPVNQNQLVRSWRGNRVY